MKKRFKDISLSTKKFLMFAVLSLLATVVNAQAITLHIGDTAPPLSYSKWLKGSPVTGFNDSKVYVLECWATWCGPCIAAMPHLSELAKKYQTTATFIGVDVSESAHGSHKTYDELLAGVERFVNSSGARMSYNVIADNQAQDMSHNWLTPAGVGAIPATFVIKNDKIVWIGDPLQLDSVMTPIIEGTFDVAAFKKQYEGDITINSKKAEPNLVALKELQDAIVGKSYTKALQLIDTDLQKMPELKLGLELEKFTIYLEQSREPEAISYAKELNKENFGFFGYKIAGVICDKDSLSSTTYLFAADNFKTGLEAKKSCLIYDKLALAYSKAGDMPAALETEEKAVKQAKVDVKDPDMAGHVFDYTITDFQEKVKKYKSELK